MRNVIRSIREAIHRKGEALFEWLKVWSSGYVPEDLISYSWSMESTEVTRTWPSSAALARNRDAEGAARKVVPRYAYRAALCKGELVDVSDEASSCRICHPTAFSKAVWDSCVRVPAELFGDDETDLVWGVLSTIRYYMKLWGPGKSIFVFDKFITNEQGQLRRVVLKAVCHSDEWGCPVVTVMFVDEH